MSLRLRVIVIVTTLVVVGIGVASISAYASTRSELMQETDRFLASRATELVDGTRQPPPARNDDSRNPPRDDEPASALDFDPDALTQIIDESGVVVASGGQALPVDEPELAVAAKNGPESALRTVQVDGADYRMLTIHDRGGGAVQVARDLGEIDEVLAGLRIRLLAVGAVLAVAAAVLGWILMRRSTRPLEDLAAAAERVAATDDLTPLGLDRHDEVGRVADSFDRMLSALAMSREQQRRLVQDAGHELRTPLTSLRANVELLQRARDLPDDELDALLGGLSSEVNELGEMFGELMQLATDTGGPSDPDVAVDLADIAEGAVERFRRRTGRDVTLRTESTPLMGNPASLERAVANLLGNAHKFSPPNEGIDVVLADRRLVVRDRGPGIPDVERAAVFHRFYRTEDARSRPGSGLGLAIVAQIAERHGGRASAGAAPGGGAEVGFTVG